MVPGFEGLAADIYWLRTVQYFGGQRLFAQGKRFELLEPLIDITTTLDPRLEIAYRYGAIFLCEPPPWARGAREGDSPPRAGSRGPASGLAPRARTSASSPSSTSATRTRPRGSSRGFRRSPGRPSGSRPWRRDVLVQGGDRTSARRMWRQMYEQAEEGRHPQRCGAPAARHSTCSTRPTA